MSLNLPSQDESQLCRCRALYLGTNIFKPKTKRLDESKLSLSILQSTIAERYPIDGSNFSKGNKKLIFFSKLIILIDLKRN
jgi:hypothetical protein